MKNPKRLIYLTLEAPREGQASYTHIHEIIDGLTSRGWIIALYQPFYTNKKASPGLLSRLVLSLALQFSLWAKWKKGSVLYIRGHYLAFPTALIARIFSIPIFHEINGPYEDVFISHPVLNGVRPVLIWMQRQQYRWATGLIAVTDGLCRWAERESGQSLCHLVSNGANVDLFRPDTEPASGLPARYVIFFGGLARWHGVETMIDAINLPLWPKDVHLVVIGDGQCRPMIEAAAIKNAHIHVLGCMNNRDIPRYVTQAIAGLVPITNPGARAESGLMPLKLLETLSCGVPAIVSDFPGQADLIRTEDCGLVMAPDNPESLAAAVAHLASQPDLVRDMGAKGRVMVVKNHSWDARAAATEGVILNHLNTAKMTPPHKFL